jgi:hypothetical protein
MPCAMRVQSRGLLVRYWYRYNNSHISQIMGPRILKIAFDLLIVDDRRSKSTTTHQGNGAFKTRDFMTREIDNRIVEHTITTIIITSCPKCNRSTPRRHKGREGCSRFLFGPRQDRGQTRNEQQPNSVVQKGKYCIELQSVTSPSSYY